MSQPYWTIIRHREVTRYLIPTDEKLRLARKPLRTAVASLQDGPPEDAELINEVTHAHKWMAANHLILFMVNTLKRLIYITLIEPVDAL